MLTTSAPLNPGQLKHYHDQEFSAAKDNYYTQKDQIVGGWHGRLATAFGLTGDVDKIQFDRLADGQHPITGEQLVHAKTSRLTPDGKPTMEHRAGWDLTFSAPKSVSITALVGGDERVRAAHVNSVTVALAEVERYTQSRRSGKTVDPNMRHQPETTSVWVAARFEHDSARPVNGYSAPQLHTHTVVFNMTARGDGRIAPVQSWEWMKTQALATAIYRAQLDLQLQALGYETTQGKYREPRIVGYTDDYLEAASPRRKQIIDQLEQAQRHGAGAARIAAHQTREKKVILSPEIVQAQHQEMAAAFGHQPARVVRDAQQRGPVQRAHTPQHSAAAAVLYARDRNNEKTARADERVFLRDALARGMGYQSWSAIRGEFERQVTAGTFHEVEQRPAVPGRAFTTPEMLTLERENITTMRAGQQTMRPMADAGIRRDIQQQYDGLNETQLFAVEQVLASSDRYQAVDGIAGGGKTTALGAVHDAAQRAGYVVQGLAPTTTAVRELNAAGIHAITLQRHLESVADLPNAKQRVWVLDESSLSSTPQAHRFFASLPAQDRVVFVGDTRQHEAVEAGRPYAQLLEAGMSVANLDVIVRQRDQELKTVVEHFAAALKHPASGPARITEAVASLERQGKVHGIPDRDARYTAIAQEFVKEPERTLVIAPANDERRDLNQTIHREMQDAGHVAQREAFRTVLVPRQDLTGADRKWAAQYQHGDVIRYTKGSDTSGIAAGTYARVLSVESDDRTNTLTVRTDAGRMVTYDPTRLSGVTVYQEQERRFAVGDRLQFTAPTRIDHLAIPNRQLGTITHVNARELSVELDKTHRRVTVPADVRQHLDYGYALTSYSSQAQTTDIVLVHVDVDQPATLVDKRMGYVALSRARDDAQIFTNDAGLLAKALGRTNDKESALSPEQTVDHARSYAA